MNLLRTELFHEFVTADIDPVKVDGRAEPDMNGNDGDAVFFDELCGDIRRAVGYDPDLHTPPLYTGRSVPAKICQARADLASRLRMMKTFSP